VTIVHLGLAAGFLTSAAAVPQMLRAWRTRSVRDVSVWQPVLLVIGMLLWLVYGAILGDVPLIAANTFSIGCNLVLIAMKYRYGRLAAGESDDYSG
jgi:MtN3 and saliva related transmembrane protein